MTDKGALSMVNLIAIVVLLAIVAGAAAYVIRAKKKGQHCIGCPHCKTCAAAKKGGCS